MTTDENSKRNKKRLRKVSLCGNNCLLLQYKRLTMAEKQFYTLEECLDERFGTKGTPERDRFDAEVAEAVHAYRIGEAITPSTWEEA